MTNRKTTAVTITTPIVTVIIPSYNHARYVKKAILSVTTQTYGNIELIVIDDGSKDESQKIIHALATEFDFTYITRENRGLSKTLNEGIALAKGKYISFLASDDYYMPQRIENAVIQLEKSHDKIAAVYCDGYVINDNEKNIDLFGTRYPRPLTGGTYNNLIVGNWIPALGMTYKLDILKIFMFDEQFKTEDYTLYLRMFSKNQWGLQYYSDFGFSYRWHGENISKNTEVMSTDKKNIENTFKTVGDFNVFKKNIANKVFSMKDMLQFGNYYLLFLLAVRLLQKKTKSNHNSFLGLFTFCLRRFRNIFVERARGLLYFGIAGYRKGIRVAGRVTVRGRGINFQFGQNCRILGDFHLVIEDSYIEKPVVIFGNNVTIEHNVYINSHGGFIVTGDNCHFGVGSIVQGKGGVTIGNGVLFGPNTKIFASNHNFKEAEISIFEAGENYTGIEIGNNIWIGAGCTILDGAVLGDGSIYGANGVINGHYKCDTLNIAKHIQAKEYIKSNDALNGKVEQI